MAGSHQADLLGMTIKITFYGNPLDFIRTVPEQIDQDSFITVNNKLYKDEKI